ncbi:HI1506-related protein [Pseudosulfitobacter pseudonitzschiae]|uniref:HI1506-related protein n=1 Tax=Pseudosulfitobacter pseudonitzschiae TaxID=1402135 RepID=UPI001AF72E2C|nr:HI1506-related protein [Pseudosulfitobacter pseudonitzschiae]MBM1833759.1 hypothetical protein [Pseudosulfitobacter pseudonitzschiae]MBM1838625.1 hypothetical protein [Pseudosulfitobacter pseudonitzschiae]MBM1842973.1 hypothetical protein [Pseudosulfitobacter pseudonitzschiae]MBM1847839.1 hypothetical protein [Pseudosulfitobacter pseudonitzschiae]MBM1853181.1 hypothetical protein [Pseudosulfitobacter pseudonitzschiae]
MTEQTAERIALEARAVELGVTFQANIGDAKLQKRVDAAEAKASSAGTAPNEQGPASNAAVPPKGETQKPQRQSVSEPFIKVLGPANGFWRCGMRFDAKPTAFGVGDLTDDQITALEAEPELTVIREKNAE